MIKKLNASPKYRATFSERNVANRLAKPYRDVSVQSVPQFFATVAASILLVSTSPAIPVVPQLDEEAMEEILADKQVSFSCKMCMVFF
jgi:hypothetical protein